MKLYAISDLHLGYTVNREALKRIPGHPEDWLIIAGDIGETEEHLHLAFQILGERFARLLWVPGNHELWSSPIDPDGPRGEEKYLRLIALCRRYGVITPEDPYLLWSGTGKPSWLAPVFTLYDYSFRPDNIADDQALLWAMESGLMCRDEKLLDSFPYASKAEWCSRRCDYTESRLAELGGETPIVLISHFPLRRELIRLFRIPRFSIWCGTSRTEDWHLRFPISVAVYGHLHIRATDLIDGVRCEEVSLGYPKEWDQRYGIEHYLREILPGTESHQLKLTTLSFTTER